MTARELIKQIEQAAGSLGRAPVVVVDSDQKNVDIVHVGWVAERGAIVIEIE